MPFTFQSTMFLTLHVRVGRCSHLCCHSCGDSACNTWRCGGGPCADIGCQNCGMSIVRPRNGDICALVADGGAVATEGEGRGERGGGGGAVIRVPATKSSAIATSSVLTPAQSAIPDTRYLCLDCLSGDGAAAEPVSVDFCEACFDDPTAAHCSGSTGGGEGVVTHANWLRIDGVTGKHAGVRMNPTPHPILVFFLGGFFWRGSWLTQGDTCGMPRLPYSPHESAVSYYCRLYADMRIC